MSDPASTRHLPARDIPIPTSVSAEAQAAMAMPPMEQPASPPLDDLAAWRTMIAEHDAVIVSIMSARTADALVRTEELDIDGLRIFQITPNDHADDDRRVYLDIHGGAFINGRGESCRAMGVGTSLQVAARVWAVDYRMPPDHPFPAALDDCLTAYRMLLVDHSPRKIIVGGASAGGNLAAATVLRARDEGLEMPAAVVLMTPGVDLTGAGDSLQTNLGLDPLIQSNDNPSFQLYAAGHDLTDPYISPLFADFGEGFPPTFVEAHWLR